jgi:ABC-type Fe3+-hydroxamate transport system substrate-binding protein
MRIVSLVPSITELLSDLGLEEEVVGITKFCIHPEHWFRTKRRVGGTKTADVESILALRPDLVLANREENVREQIEALEDLVPVYISDVNDLTSALAMIREVGRLTGREERAAGLVESIRTGFEELKRPIGVHAKFSEWLAADVAIPPRPGMPVGRAVGRPGAGAGAAGAGSAGAGPAGAGAAGAGAAGAGSAGAGPEGWGAGSQRPGSGAGVDIGRWALTEPIPCAYFIWRNPWMVAGGDTFINDMLERAGFINVFRGLTRYPTIDADTLSASGCRLVLLSSEPYPFREKHVSEFRAVVPNARVWMVDGEMFSWYGSRMTYMPLYFNYLKSKLP